MYKFKFKGRKSKPEGAVLILILVGCGALLMLLCSIISSAVIFSLEDPGAMIGIAGLCSVIFSAGICGTITSFFTEGTIKYSLIVGGILAMLLFVFPIIFGGSIGGGAMNALCYFGVSVLAAPIFKKKRRNRR